MTSHATHLSRGPMLDGAQKDAQSITADWQPTDQSRIDGLRVIDIRAVPKRSGLLTEIFRREWVDGQEVDQVFQVVLNPGAISAWHVHVRSMDRLFVSVGSATLALYDARPASTTAGAINELQLNAARPQLVVIPAGVWHGLLTTSPTPALVLNLPDTAYEYKDPDHWRLPYNSAEIPYRFRVREALDDQ